MLITGSGQCTVTIGSTTHNLTSTQPGNTPYGTPYIVYFNKGSGQVSFAIRLFYSQETITPSPGRGVCPKT